MGSKKLITFNPIQDFSRAKEIFDITSPYAQIMEDILFVSLLSKLGVLFSPV